MAIEIEHKYLVNHSAWAETTPDRSVDIRQGYLVKELEKSVRLRIAGNKSFITIKGKTLGASRPEFEYEIPLKDAEEILKNFCSTVVEKIRHYVYFEGNTWEVDEFKGLNKGLIVAEIELTSESQQYLLPPWVEEEVTEDTRYLNANLSTHPFTVW